MAKNLAILFDNLARIKLSDDEEDIESVASGDAAAEQDLDAIFQALAQPPQQ